MPQMSDGSGAPSTMPSGDTFQPESRKVCRKTPWAFSSQVIPPTMPPANMITVPAIEGEGADDDQRPRKAGGPVARPARRGGGGGHEHTFLPVTGPRHTAAPSGRIRVPTGYPTTPLRHGIGPSTSP